jgi:hypothetical protein
LPLDKATLIYILSTLHEKARFATGDSLFIIRESIKSEGGGKREEQNAKNI